MEIAYGEEDLKNILFASFNVVEIKFDAKNKTITAIIDTKRISKQTQKSDEKGTKGMFQ